MSNRDRFARLSSDSLLHRLRRVPVPLASTLAVIDDIMYDESMAEISISRLLDTPEIRWYENPHKALTQMASQGFLIVRKVYTKQAPRGYRYFHLSPRGKQIAEDYRELQTSLAIAYRKRVTEATR